MPRGHPRRLLPIVHLDFLAVEKSAQCGLPPPFWSTLPCNGANPLDTLFLQSPGQTRLTATFGVIPKMMAPRNPIVFRIPPKVTV